MPDKYRSKKLAPESYEYYEYAEQAPHERDPVSGAPESTAEKKPAPRIPDPNEK